MNFPTTVLRQLTTATILGWASLVSLQVAAVPGENPQDHTQQQSDAQVVPIEEALQTPVIAAVDPDTMHWAEIERTLGAEDYCTFAYTAEGLPVVAVTSENSESGYALIKINGQLVQLQAEGVGDYRGLTSAAIWSANGATIAISLASGNEVELTDQRRAADVIFTLEQGLEVGYHGWFNCHTE